MLPNATA